MNYSETIDIDINYSTYSSLDTPLSYQHHDDATYQQPPPHHHHHPAHTSYTTSSSPSPASTGPVMKSIQGNQQKKKSKGSNVTGLIQFHYESNRTPAYASDYQPKHHTHHHHQQRHRKGGKATASEDSSTIFLLSNFRFAVSEDAELNAPAYLSSSPDVMIPWKDIEYVIPHHKRACFRCPICLDDCFLPKITKCGHVYCFTCLLQYMNYEELKSCPICGQKLHLNEMKSIHQDTSPPTSKGSNNSNTQGKHRSGHSRSTSEVSLSLVDAYIGKKCTFTLYHRRSSDAYPWRVSHPNPNSPNPSPAFNETSYPSISSSSATYSKVCLISLSEIITLAAHELTLLTTFQQFCSNPAIAVEYYQHPRADEEMWKMLERADVEYLPVLTLAMEMINQRLHHLQTLQPACKPTSSPQRENVWSTNKGIEGGLIYYCTSIQDMEMNSPHLLHPFNMKILAHQYAPKLSYDVNLTHEAIHYPLTFHATIVDIEFVKVSENSRKKFAFLKHIPLDTEFAFVEIEMNPRHPPRQDQRVEVMEGEDVGEGVISAETYEVFRGEMKNRKKEKMRKSHRKKKEEQTQKMISEMKDADMVAWRKKLYEERQLQQAAAVNELLHGPKLFDTSGVEASEASSENRTTGDDHDSRVENSEMKMNPKKAGNFVINETNFGTSSFARITEMGGHYPVLSTKAKPPQPPQSLNPSIPSAPIKQQQQGSWIHVATNSSSTSTTSESNMKKWSPPPVPSPSDSSSTSTSFKSKKKGVSLLSISSQRSYK